MKRICVLAALAVSVLFAGAASAGTAYVPAAMNRTIEGKQYRTVLWITNTGDSKARVNLRFIESLEDGTDGLQDGAEPDESLVIGPGATVPTLAGLGTIGMLEVSTESDEVFFVAELNSFNPGGQRLASTYVPLIDAENLLSAGETAHLLALERQAQASQTQLGLVNLGGEATDCVIRAFRPGGEQIQATVTIPVPALSHREFSGAFGILGESSITGGRFEVNCDRPFYTYGMVLSRIPDSTQFVAPAAGGPNGLIDPVATGELARLDGQFFHASRSTGELRVPLAAPVGVEFESMTIDFDMQTARFPTNLYTATAQLRRNGPGGLFWAHTIRAGGRDKTLLDMNDELVHQGATGKWSQNAKYHVRVVYDTVAGRIDWHVTQGNRTVERLNRSIRRSDLRHDGQGLVMIFGLSRVYDDSFFPPYGFRFSNLVVSGVAAAQ